MHIARKATLAVVMAIAAAAFVSGTALAQETPVTVGAEPSGEPCNPCVGHDAGESHIVALPSGVEISTCEDEFVTFVYGNGTGEMEWLGTAHGGAGCNTTNCSVMSPHWPVFAAGELGGEVEHTRATICLRAGSTELECQVEITLTRTPTTHHGAYSMNQLCSGGARRLESTGLGEITAAEAVHED